MENKKGFTLAEVLITLTIIGIVAALTIPTLINNVNEAQYNAGVKDIYNKLSSTLSMAVSNNGGLIHAGISGSTADAFRNDFCNVMGCTQYYNNEQDTYNNLYNNNYSFYKGGGINSSLYGLMDYWYSNVDMSGASLNNGNYLVFIPYTDCTSSSYFAQNNPLQTGICGEIIVDTNGTQGPNMAGQDLYFFHVSQDNNQNYSIQPWGTPDDINSQGGDCGIGGQGSMCAYQRIYGIMP